MNDYVVVRKAEVKKCYEHSACSEELRFHFYEESLFDSHNTMMLTVIDMSRGNQPVKKKEEPEEEEGEEEEEWEEEEVEEEGEEE